MEAEYSYETLVSSYKATRIYNVEVIDITELFNAVRVSNLTLSLPLESRQLSCGDAV
jgi:hypothetical protein